ncbi:MAG: hypothetical protein ABI425_05615 [Patescibacteria group bacterium]
MSIELNPKYADDLHRPHLDLQQQTEPHADNVEHCWMCQTRAVGGCNSFEGHTSMMCPLHFLYLNSNFGVFEPKPIALIKNEMNNSPDLTPNRNGASADHNGREQITETSGEETAVMMIEPTNEKKNLGEAVTEVVTQSKTARKFLDGLKLIIKDYSTEKDEVINPGIVKLSELTILLEKLYKDVYQNLEIYNNRGKFINLAISFGVPNVFADTVEESTGKVSGAASFRLTFCRLLASEIGVQRPKQAEKLLKQE